MTHSIRLALADDYPAICAYLNAHWRPGHIFTKSEELLRWQHWDKARERYNFVLGIEPRGAIHGVLGFIPNGQFDPDLGHDSVFLCIWSVCDAARGHGLGTRMLDFIEETFKPTFLATVGASEMSLPIYEKRGWVTGKMEHWYLRRGDAVAPLESFSFTCEETLPTKGAVYTYARYTSHPFYRYRVAGGTVLRLCSAGDTRILRMVDCQAPLVLYAVPWNDVMRDAEVDMVDFYCAGFDNVQLEDIGFTRRIADEVIIPNHFEPYEHRNIDILYAVKAPKGMPWRLVRGDGDMDRPNVLP